MTGILFYHGELEMTYIVTSTRLQADESVLNNVNSADT